MPPPCIRVVTLLDQHAPDVQSIGKRHCLCDPAGMCGFLSLAMIHCNVTTTKLPLDTAQRKALLEELDARILPRFCQLRQDYIETHPDEFCREGASWQESGGRMSSSTFRNMMAGTAEIQHYLRTTQSFETPVYLLRPILEGPAINETSIRFPPSPHVMELDRLFVEEERCFYKEQQPHDYYVGDTTNQCYSLSDWGRIVYNYLRGNPENCVWIILDLHGHYCAARIFKERPNCEQLSCMVFETVETSTVLDSPVVLALAKTLSIWTAT